MLVYPQKGLVTRNTHVKYHSSSFDSDRITKWQDKNNMPPTPPPQIFDLGGLKIPICTFSSSKNVIEIPEQEWNELKLQRPTGLNGHLSIKDSTLTPSQKGSYLHTNKLVTELTIDLKCMRVDSLLW